MSRISRIATTIQTSWSNSRLQRARALALVLALGLFLPSASWAATVITREDGTEAFAPDGKGGGTLLNPPHTDDFQPMGPSGNGIQYHGGPIMLGTPNIYYIWYGNWFGNTAFAILTDWANAIGGSPYYDINTTYCDGSGTHLRSAAHYVASTFDNYSRGTSLSDTDVRNIVADSITGGAFPADSNGIYFVLTSADVSETSGFCNTYCGWHNYAYINGTNIKYSFVGNADRCPQNCAVQYPTSPNDNPGADAMVSTVAHEFEETTSDPNLNAWYDLFGNENADKCAWTYGPEYALPNGSFANMRIGNRDYLIQRNWVNANGGFCATWYRDWNRFPLAQAGSASGNGGIAAVSRIPSAMELWWIGLDGSVRDAYWYEGSPWGQFQLAPPGSASTTGGITAVSRIPGSLEVWWIGQDGSVRDAYWYEGGWWQQFQLAPPGSASTSGGITAVSKTPGSMELWWIGQDGSVQGAFIDFPGNWQRYQLASPGSAATSSRITALSRTSNSKEVWWIGQDGSVRDAYCYDGSPWGQFQLAPPGSASTTGGITAVSRMPGSMEVWWIGPNGSVQDAFWYDGGSWGQFQLASAGSARTSGGITAISRSPDNMEVWWVGEDGSVQDAFWYHGSRWTQFQLAPPWTASVYGGIKAISRIPNSMELWWIGPFFTVEDAYWYD